MHQLTPDDVQAALTDLELDAQIQTFDESTRTAPEAAAAIGTELGSIVKSLCFMVAGEPIMVLTAGDQRADDRKIAALFSVGRKKVRLANADTTIEMTGYPPGGVPPVGHRQNLPIYIDSTLERFDIVYAAAGTASTIFPIAFDALVKATGGTIIDVARE